MKKNSIRTGLKSNKKLKSSFYSFLFEKHFDWAIILAAFFSTIPYLPSEFYTVLLLKCIVFSSIIYFCIRYILGWKQLQEYYEIYKKAIEKNKSLIDRNKLKDTELKDFEEFHKNFLEELEKFGNSFKSNNENLSLTEYIKKYPDKGRPLEEILNKDIKLTQTSFGLALGTMTLIIHLRGIPREELKNYRRILFILSLTVIFFALYLVEMSFF